MSISLLGGIFLVYTVYHSPQFLSYEHPLPEPFVTIRNIGIGFIVGAVVFPILGVIAWRRFKRRSQIKARSSGTPT